MTQEDQIKELLKQLDNQKTIMGYFRYQIRDMYKQMEDFDGSSVIDKIKFIKSGKFVSGRSEIFTVPDNTKTQEETK